MVLERRPKTSEAKRGEGFGFPPLACLIFAALSLGLIYLITGLSLSRHFSIMAMVFPFIAVGIIGLAGLGLVIFRRSGWILSLVIAVCLFAYGQGLLTDLIRNGAPPKTASGTVRVMSYNWLGSNNQSEAFTRWVAAHPVDIIALQETPEVLRQQFPDELKRLYPYQTTIDRKTDLLILSRYPMESQVTIPVGSQYLLHARIRTPQGLLDVYNLHPETVRSRAQWLKRNHYLEDARLVIDGKADHVLVMGDFNATIWDPIYRKLVSTQALHAQPTFYPATTRVVKQVEGHRFGAAVDHVLGGDNIYISGCKRGSAMGSDHLPMVCDLTFRPVR